MWCCRLQRVCLVQVYIAAAVCCCGLVPAARAAPLCAWVGGSAMRIGRWRRGPWPRRGRYLERGPRRGGRVFHGIHSISEHWVKETFAQVMGHRHTGTLPQAS